MLEGHEGISLQKQHASLVSLRGRPATPLAKSLGMGRVRGRSRFSIFPRKENSLLW